MSILRNPKEMLRRLRKRISRNSLEARVHRQLAWEYYLKREFPSAEKAYLKAIELDSGDGDSDPDSGPDLRVLLAHLYFHWERYPDALKYYKKALTPDQTYLHFYIGNLHLKQEEHSKAINAFERALDAKVSDELKAQILNALGTAHAQREDQRRDLEKALMFCLEAEIRDPAKPMMANDSGVVYYWQAVAEHERTAAEKEKSAKRIEVAIRLLDQAIEKFEHAFQLAMAARDDAQFSKTFTTIQIDKAEAYFKRSQWIPGEAKKYQRKATNELDLALTEELAADDKAATHDFKGWILVDVGDVEGALREARKAVRLAPDNHSYSANLAYAYYKNRNYRKAILEYKRALNPELKAGPDDVHTYHSMLGLIYDAMEQPEKALAEYEIAVKMKPDDAVSHGNLAKAYNESKQYDKAIDEYQKALKLDPNNDSYHNALGNVYFNKDDYAKSIDSYERAIQLVPGEADYHYNIAQAYRLAEMYDQAATEYQAAIEINGKEPDFHAGLGHCYLAMEKNHEAVIEYRKAIKLNEKDADFPYWLGLAYKRSRQFKKAETQYRKALALSPEHSDAQRSIGLLYQATGRYDEAVPELEKALATTPNDVDILMALGLSEVETNKTKQGLEHLERAKNLADKDARTYDALGRGYNRLRDYERAVEVLQQGLEKFPEDPSIREELNEANIGLAGLKKDPVVTGLQDAGSDNASSEQIH